MMGNEKILIWLTVCICVQFPLAQSVPFSWSSPWGKTDDTVPTTTERSVTPSSQVAATTTTAKSSGGWFDFDEDEEDELTTQKTTTTTTTKATTVTTTAPYISSSTAFPTDTSRRIIMPSTSTWNDDDRTTKRPRTTSKTETTTTRKPSRTTKRSRSRSRETTMDPEEEARLIKQYQIENDLDYLEPGPIVAEAPPTFAPPSSASPPFAPKAFANRHEELAESYIEKKQQRMHSIYLESEFDTYLVTYTTLLKIQSVMDGVKTKISHILGKECRDHMPWFKPLLLPIEIENVYEYSQKERECLALKEQLDTELEEYETLVIANKKFREESNKFMEETNASQARYSHALKSTLGSYMASERELYFIRSVQAFSADEPKPTEYNEDFDDGQNLGKTTTNKSKNRNEIIPDNIQGSSKNSKTRKSNNHPKHHDVLEDQFLELSAGRPRVAQNESESENEIELGTSSANGDTIDGPPNVVETKTPKKSTSQTTASKPSTTKETTKKTTLADAPHFASKTTAITHSSPLTVRLSEIEQISNITVQIVKYKDIINETIQQGFKNNTDIFKVASRIKNAPSQVHQKLNKELKKYFPSAVQLIIWGNTSKLKVQSNESTFKLFADKQNLLKAQKLRRNSQFEKDSALDGDEWKFIPLQDADSFSLVNVKTKSALTIEFEQNNTSNNMIPGLENITSRDVALLPLAFRWRIALICDTTIVGEIQKENYKYDYIEEAKDVGVFVDSTKIGWNGELVPLAESEAVSMTVIGDENLCREGAWLVTLMNVWKPEKSLDVGTSGEVYLGKTGQAGRFQVFN